MEFLSPSKSKQSPMMIFFLEDFDFRVSTQKKFQVMAGAISVYRNGWRKFPYKSLITSFLTMNHGTRINQH